MTIDNFAEDTSAQEFLDMINKMCNDFDNIRPKPTSNNDVKLVLTRENIFDSFQECYAKQDHTRTKKKLFTTVKEDTNMSGLYTIVIIVMNMYLNEHFLKEIYDLIIKNKHGGFLNGIINFGVILFQVCDSEEIVSNYSYFYCITGKTYFLNNIIKEKNKFREKVLPALRVLSNLVWFCFIHHELLTDAKLSDEVSCQL